MQGMPRIDKKWMRAIGAALVLVGVLAVVSAVFAGRSGQADVIRRTPTPSFTPSPSNTPTDTDTPTSTETPPVPATATFTPTPQTPKNPGSNAVIIGGSTGSAFLSTSGTSFVPLFDGAGGSFGPIGHLALPGRLTHLEVLLDPGLTQGESFVFTLVVNGQKQQLIFNNLQSVSCTIPSKKADFCADGDKNSDCVEVGPQDRIAVQVVPQGTFLAGQAAGGNGAAHIRMSWVAKLDLYGECSD
jgi:hypothetical protein